MPMFIGGPRRDRTCDPLVKSPNQPVLPLFADHDLDLPESEFKPENIDANATSIDPAVCRREPRVGARKGQKKGNAPN
jgi:hypothetical protein